MFKMVILAARRVLPPDLMTPANESKPRMNETGPEAKPPPDKRSREDRKGDKLEPAPEPNLKIIPSVLAKVKIESMVSRTDRIKQAEHWGWV